MRLFQRTHVETPPVEATADTAWPEDSLDDVDDDAFAQAIAEGRRSEHPDELVEA
jgi:hypothetical protein